MARRRLSQVVAVATIVLLAMAGPASAHTSLLASDPASGQRVAYSPDEIVLTFATEVDPGTVSATLRSASGEEVPLTLLTESGSATAVVAFGVPRLPHDVYGLAWQSVGDDGHRVVGEVLFGVGAEVATTADIAVGGAGPATWVQDGAALVLRVLGYLMLALLAGAWVVGRAVESRSAGVARRAIRRLLMGLAGVSLLRAGVAMWILLDAGASGPSALLARGVLWLLVLVGACAALFWLAGRTRDPAPPAWLAAAGLGVGVVAMTLAGHAPTRPEPVLAGTFAVIHLLAGAVWVGPLVVLLAVTRTPVWTRLPSGERRSELGRVLATILPFASWSLAGVAVSGVMLAVRTWDTLEGGVLAVLGLKALIIVAVVVPLAWWHHRTRQSWASVPRTVRVEAAGLAVVMVLGGVLVGWDPGWSASSADLDPAVTAVLDGSAEDPQACGELEVGRASCYRTTLSTMLATDGPQVAIDTIAELQQTDPYVADNCHQVAHDLGNDAAEQIEEMADALAVDGSVCWSGYYHGFIEARLAGIDDDELVQALPSFCDGAADPAYSFTHYNCLHGLGHGLMLRVDAELFEALPLCREVGEHWAVRSCASGVFMENVIAGQQGLDVAGLDEDDLLYPCTEVAEDLAEDCYLMQTSHILWRLDYDFAGAFAWCDQLEEGNRATCYRSMGRDISSASALDPNGIIERCSLGASEFAQWCIDGAASNAVYEQAGHEAANALCEAVPSEWLDRCTAARDQALDTVARG